MEEGKHSVHGLPPFRSHDGPCSVFQSAETAARARTKFFIRTLFCQGFNLPRKVQKQTDEPDVSLRQIRRPLRLPRHDRIREECPFR
jgi:hypothetical protein